MRQMLRFLLLAALTFSHPALAASTPLSSIIGATHWSPCYFMNASLPSLVDGAVSLAAMGTHVWLCTPVHFIVFQFISM
jgi:hypothetical protein